MISGDRTWFYNYCVYQFKFDGLNIFNLKAFYNFSLRLQ